MPEEDEDEIADAWGAEPVATKKKKEVVVPKVTSYDDGGEPDFEGWLEAKAKAKSGGGAGGSGKVLPKGLAKKAPASTLGAARTVGTKAAPVKSQAVVPKKKEVKKVEDEEDDWGDAWN
jgi:SCY1-like protein 1